MKKPQVEGLRALWRALGFVLANTQVANRKGAGFRRRPFAMLLLAVALNACALSAYACGLGVPQLPQKLPAFLVPHVGQAHSAGAWGTGFGVPHCWQKLPPLIAPHVGHAQPSAGTAAGAAAMGTGA